MSYSRWSNSYWYTYWCSTKNETYDTATFCICNFDDNLMFTAKKLRNQFDKCVDIIKVNNTNATKEEITEVICYLHKFLDDVDKLYSIKR